MNKNAIRWWVVLGVVLVVYNVLAFALPFPKKAVFAVSYLFTMIAILAQIYVIRTAFYRGEGVKSKFYGFPIAKLGVIYLAVQLIAGLVFMALGLIVPVWLPLALYVVLLGIAAAGFVAADAGAGRSRPAGGQAGEGCLPDAGVPGKGAGPGHAESGP